MEVVSSVWGFFRRAGRAGGRHTGAQVLDKQSTALGLAVLPGATGLGDAPGQETRLFKSIHLEGGRFLICTNAPRLVMALAAVMCTYYVPGPGLKA